MSVHLDNHGFRDKWSDFSVNYYKGFHPNMTDYHMHEYYEVSLILSGEVSVLLPNASHCGQKSVLMLAGPMTPHLVTCEPHVPYERYNLLFSGQFLAQYVPEWRELLAVFGKSGNLIPISAEVCDAVVAIIRAIKAEKNAFRARLLLLLFLSKAGELDTQPTNGVPPYVSGALSYLQEHYAEHIVASGLAARLGVSRTTLMTAFRHYTGTTLGTYLAKCRLRAAIARLREGMTEQAAAEVSGLGDACTFIRCARRHLGATPRQYLQKSKEGDA